MARITTRSEAEPERAHPGHDSTARSKKIYLTASQVRDRYGGVSAMTIHRWLRDPRMRFPEPLYIGRLRYWSLPDLEVWERTRARRDVPEDGC